RVQTEESRDADRESGFLEWFAHRGVRRSLAEIDEPARERPFALRRADRPARQQNPAVLFRNRRGDELGIEVEHEAAPGAYRVLLPTGWQALAAKRAPAERAEPDRARRQDALRMRGVVFRHCVSLACVRK